MIEAHPSVNPLGSLPKRAKRTALLLRSAVIRPVSLVPGQYGANFTFAAPRTSGRLAPALALGPGNRSWYRSDLPRWQRQDPSPETSRSRFILSGQQLHTIHPRRRSEERRRETAAQKVRIRFRRPRSYGCNGVTSRPRRETAPPCYNQRVSMTRSLTISYDDSVFLEASQTRDEFEREAKLLLAAMLFELGRLSSGKAAELCGMGRVEFLLALPRVGASLSNLGPEDADDEAAFANRT